MASIMTAAVDMQLSVANHDGAHKIPSSLTHNLANHGSLPDMDDVHELIVYLTLLIVVLSWMLREIHIAFFNIGIACH